VVPIAKNVSLVVYGPKLETPAYTNISTKEIRFYDVKYFLASVYSTNFQAMLFSGRL